MSNTIFWGDSHHNTYQHCRQDPPLNEVLDFARTHLDFYTGAYYTAVFTQYALLPESRPGANLGKAIGHAYEASIRGAEEWSGVRVEAFKPPEIMAREWAEFQEVVRAQNTPGRFVAFPGYEWQGNSKWGDHNVIYREEGPPICTAMELPQLYEFLHGQNALAIPHHTGYMPGMRAPRWEACDTALSPFSEIFSVHGCSETDEERPGLRRNPHMGPGTGGGAYQAALRRGLRLGAVCSTDNWTNMPGHWGHGLMAVLAPELTREALWDAFHARRVYGVTGDRIELDFTCNGEPMGSILPAAKSREIALDVTALDALDRIEILRNEEVVHTYCHQGAWSMPEAGTRTAFRLRIEAGWGPLLGELPDSTHGWDVEVQVDGGQFTSWSPCWTTRGQGVPRLRGDTAAFTLLSEQTTAAVPNQNAVVLELVADPAAVVRIRVNGKVIATTVAECFAGSRIIWFPEETRDAVRQLTGFSLPPDVRQDMPYHMSWKVKVHRAMPQAAYRASVRYTDDSPADDGVFYRVRVEQRNGQRAWSSPIWFEPGT